MNTEISEGAGLARILISACLTGDPVRYDAGHKWLADERLARWKQQGRLVVVCPEVAGGLPTPRPPAEIQQASGAEVLSGRARIVDIEQDDPTEAFLRGAHLALHAAKRHGCRLALLTDGSPSCGSATIYSGDFTGTRREGEGVTAALLRANGVEVFSQHQLEALDRRLAELDSRTG
ncbi:DUF523 domain-containing protein [Halomonas cupida]|uniref:DUF523 domain-containing protein n=1 Tax=Halomonas cupida TaxID=44933 RepID=UPI0039B5BA16